MTAAGALVTLGAALLLALIVGGFVYLGPGPKAKLGHATTVILPAGARVTEMEPAEHDAVLAAVSHLPHLLSFALVRELTARADAAGLLAHAGAGFRDVSRLAASNPEMWRDICLANRDALLGELRRYQDELARLGAALEQSDGEALERAFAAARAARRAWMARDGE